MEGIKDFIQARIDQNKNAEDDFEKEIQIDLAIMRDPETTDGQIQFCRYGIERCIAKKNELLAVTCFASEILSRLQEV
jgi:hypothetical protein